MTIMHYQEAYYSAETDDDDFERKKGVLQKSDDFDNNGWY